MARGSWLTKVCSTVVRCDSARTRDLMRTPRSAPRESARPGVSSAMRGARVAVVADVVFIVVSFVFEVGHTQKFARELADLDERAGVGAVAARVEVQFDPTRERDARPELRRDDGPRAAAPARRGRFFGRAAAREDAADGVERMTGLLE